MPYASEKQANLMRAVAHSPEFAKKVNIPTAVGRKFEAHKAEGGAVKKSMKAIFGGKESKAEEAAERKAVGGSKAKYAAMEKKYEGEYARGGGVERKGKTQGTMVKMARGGGVESRGKTQGKMITMKRGGSCK